MENLRGLLGIRRVSSLECTDKGVVWSDERINKGVLRRFGHVERMEEDRTAKRVIVGYMCR